MKLTTKSRYGVRAIFDIAYHSGELETKLTDISRRQGISPRYIQQIFQKLKRGKIITSTRGRNGGYLLARKPEEITIGEIIQLTEGGIDPVFCVNEQSRKKCERSQECVTRDIWREAGRKLKEYFDSVTIKDLCDTARKKGVEREIDQKYVFHI
jgi:Rrf2 family transcriptional regulator, iron-sulfur cluster assembly transcription factor